MGLELVLVLVSESRKLKCDYCSENSQKKIGGDTYVQSRRASGSGRRQTVGCAEVA